MYIFTSDVYKSPNHVHRTSRFQHGAFRPYPNDHEKKLARAKHVRIAFPLVGTDHRLASANVIGCVADVLGCDASVDKVYTDKYMCARGKNYRITSKKRTGVYAGRKGSQRKHLQLASNGKVFESSTQHSAMISHHRTSLAVRSIIFITTTTARSDMGEISKLFVC